MGIRNHVEINIADGTYKMFQNPLIFSLEMLLYISQTMKRHAYNSRIVNNRMESKMLEI